MDDKKILKEALERFKQCEEAWDDFRKAFKEDLQFVSGDQWQPLARQQRTEASRPCFTVDRINPGLRQIVNENRQNRPSIKIAPVSAGASQQVANIFSGMIRHIESDSNADAAYDNAGWYAAAGGVGYFRIRPEYERYDSFEQKLMIEPIADPMTVFFDPESVKPDGSDAHYCFIVDTITKQDFMEKYPDSNLAKEVEKLGSWQNYSSTEPDWMGDDSIRIAEYFFKDHDEKTLYLVRDNMSGQVMATMEKPDKDIIDAGMAEILNSRKTFIPVVRWCLLTSEEVLFNTVFESDYIPVIPVYGEDYFVDGERVTCGAVRRAKDAQKILNFTVSLQTEIIDLNAKAPFIGAVGQFDSLESMWRDANRKNFGYLEYNPTDVNGNPQPAPQRNAIEAPIQSVQATKMQAVEDIKSIFGIFDASLGAAGNEISGVAINARKQQSGISNYHYYDNLVRSVRHGGKILLQAIPKYYDTERMVRILKPTGEQEIILINGVNEEGKVVDLSMGYYDVIVQTGPTFSTKREEAVEKGIALITAYPNAAPLISDLVVDNMDFEGAQQMARRLRAAVPPEVLMNADEEVTSENAKEKVQLLTAQLQQAKQSLEALNAHAANVENQLSAEKQENILMKMKADIEIRKAEMDQMIKLKQFAVEEQRTELDFLIKEQEIILQKKQLKLEEAKLAMNGVKMMTDVEDKIFDRTAKDVEIKASMEPDAVDIATPSEIMKPTSGLTGQT